MNNQKEKINNLEIILKISERCNINCDYCYVFNKGNELSKNSPAVISEETIISLRGFLERSAKEYNIVSMQIDFHGGEPLMLKKERFDKMCNILINGNYTDTKIELALQTNAVLIDEEWIALFEKHQVHVSISIDGPKHINDLHRLDRSGKSTYEATVKGFKLLQNAWKSGRIPGEPGILSVVNPKTNGGEIYRHLVDILDCKRIDFLIPDDHHENEVDGDGIGRFLNEALDEWFSDGNPKNYVRIFNTYLETMLDNPFSKVVGMSNDVKSVYAFTVGADGLVRIDDTLRSTSDRIFSSIGHTKKISLSAVFADRNVKEYLHLNAQLPADCEDCIWNKICHGGRLVNRFSREKRFTNKTVFCNSMRIFLSRAASHLLASGIDEDVLMKNIQIQQEKQ